MTDSETDTLPPFLTEWDEAPRNDSRVCPRCGTTVADLRNDGRMGCAECYIVFGDVVGRALVALHGYERHTGKTP